MKLFITLLLSSTIILSTFSQTAPEIEWQNTIGGSSFDFLHSIQQTTDGGYILGGYSKSDISGDKTEDSNGEYDYWIVKLDENGNILWQNSIGGSDRDILHSILQTDDGGYFLGGYSKSDISGDKTEDSNGAEDYWVVKLDENGNILWQNSIGGSDGDILNSIQQTSDGGYILGGFSWSDISGDKTENSNGTEDYWVVKLDENGSILWQNSIGGSDFDKLYSIQQTSDGGYILGGDSWSDISGDKTEDSNGGQDYWVIKLDENGNIVWQNTIGGSHIDVLNSVQQTADGGYILGGYSMSNISGDKTEDSRGEVDYWVVKLDETGNIIWQITIGGNNIDELNSIQQTTDGGYILGGPSYSNISGDKTEDSQGDSDYWVVKLDKGSGINEELNQFFTVYPNPVEDLLTIVLNDNAHQPNIRIYNIEGQKIYNNEKVFQKNTYQIDMSNFRNGVYFVEVTSDVSTQRVKVIVE